jgi:hypothetical protein
MPSHVRLSHSESHRDGHSIHRIIRLLRGGVTFALGELQPTLSYQHFAQEGVLLAATLLEACWDNITQHESNSFDPFRPR